MEKVADDTKWKINRPEVRMIDTCCRKLESSKIKGGQGLSSERGGSHFSSSDHNWAVLFENGR